MNRSGTIAALGVSIAVLAFYLGDVAVFEMRVRRGTAYRTIEVNQFLTTPLKGQKEEYDVTGTLQVLCGRTIFPRTGLPACWWLERHASQWH